MTITLNGVPIDTVIRCVDTECAEPGVTVVSREDTDNSSDDVVGWLHHYCTTHHPRCMCGRPAADQYRGRFFCSICI